MEEVGTIRHLVLAEGWTIRRVARELRVSRNTIRRYLAGAEPGLRKQVVRVRPVLGRVQARLDALLAEAPRWTQGKQRLTATRLHRLLIEEGHAVGATLVKAYVAEWKRRRQEVFIPLVYEPGDLGEIDFFEVWVDVAAVRQKAWLFVVRLMASGRDSAGSTRGRTRCVSSTGTSARSLMWAACRTGSSTIICGRRSRGCWSGRPAC